MAVRRLSEHVESTSYLSKRTFHAEKPEMGDLVESGLRRWSELFPELDFKIDSSSSTINFEQAYLSKSTHQRFRELELSDLIIPGKQFQFKQELYKLLQKIEQFNREGYYHGAMGMCRLYQADNDALFIDPPFIATQFLRRSLDFEGREWSKILPFVPLEILGYASSGSNEQLEVYGIGMLLMRLFTQKMSLFKEGDPQSVIQQILEFDSSQALEHFGSRSLKQVISKAAHKSTNARYATLKGLRWDLEYIGHKENHELVALGRHDKSWELRPNGRLIGREAALKSLTNCLDKASSTKPSVRMVGAPSGMGKSHLLTEFMNEAKKRSINVFYAKFSKFEINLPLSAVHRCLHQHAEWLRHEERASELKAWQDCVRETLGDQGAIVARRMHSHKDLWPKFPEAPSLEREEEEKLFFRLFAKTMASLSSDGTHLVVIDDLQWADERSMRLFEEITTYVDALPHFGLIGAYRSEEVGERHPLRKKILKKLSEDGRIDLGPLTFESTRSIIADLLDEKESAATDLARVIYRSSKGHPFHTIEILRTLTSEHVLCYKSSQLTFVEDDALNLIELGSSSLILQRLANLDEQCIDVLGTAAVLGQSFSKGLLEHVIQELGEERLHDPDLKSRVEKRKINSLKSAGLKQTKYSVNLALSELTNHSFIRKSSSYHFAHDRIREAVWDRYDIDKHKKIHSIVISYYDRKYDNLEKIESKEIFEMAYHAMNTGSYGNHQTIVRFLMEAGKRAAEVFAYAKAVDYLSFYQSSTSDFSNYVDEDLHMQSSELLADCLSANGQYSRAVIVLKSLLDHSKDDYHRATLCGKISSNYLYLFKYPDSIGYGKKGLRLLNAPFITEISLVLFMIPVLLPIFLFSLFLSLFISPFFEIKDKKDLARWNLLLDLEVPFYFTTPLCVIANHLWISTILLFCKPCPVKTRSHLHWAVILSSIGMHRTAEKLFDRAERFLDETPNPVISIFLSLAKGYLLYLPTGRIENARTLLHKTISESKSIGETFWRMLAMQGLIESVKFGDLQDGTLEVCQDLIDLGEKTGIEATVYNNVLTHYWLYSQDDFEQLFERVSQATQETITAGYGTIDGVYGMISTAEIMLWQGRSQEAYSRAQQSFSIAARKQHRVVSCNLAPILLARSAAKMGQRSTALLSVVYAWIAQAIGVKLFLPQTQWATAEVMYAFGLKKMGRMYFERAIQSAWSKNAEIVGLQVKLAFIDKIESSPTKDILKKYVITRLYELGWHTWMDQLLSDWSEEPEQKQVAISEVTEIEESDKADLKTKIDFNSTIRLMTQITGLTNREDFADKLIDALSVCCGADHGCVMEVSDDLEFSLLSSLNMSHERLSSLDYVGADFDYQFVSKCIVGSDVGIQIRERSGSIIARERDVLFIPLKIDGRTAAFVYLGNKHVSNIFDNLQMHFVEAIRIQGEIALNNLKLAESRESAARLESELETASLVQKAFLKDQDLPEFISLSKYYKAAEQTGGDWLGYHYDKEYKQLFIFITDVTGHGVASALMTGVLCGAIYGSPLVRRRRNENYSEMETRLTFLAEYVSECISDTGFAIGRLATGIFFGIDFVDQKLSMVSAGHNHPLLFQGSRVRSLVFPSPRFGAVSKPQFSCKTYDFKPGDTLFSYTDGLIENEGKGGEVLSMRKIKNQLKVGSFAEKSQQITNLIEENFKGVPPEDDLAYVLVSYSDPK